MDGGGAETGTDGAGMEVGSNGAAFSFESSIHPDLDPAADCQLDQECSFVLCPALKLDVRAPLGST